MASSSRLTMMAEGLCEAIMHHSKTLGRENVALVEVAEPERRIAELTSNYRDVVKERTGIDVEFRQQSLPDRNFLYERLCGASVTDSEAMSNKAPSQDEEVFVVAKWFIQVSMPEAFIQFAHQHVGRDVATTEEAARLLCERDGWKPEEYPKGLITVLSHDVQICLG